MSRDTQPPPAPRRPMGVAAQADAFIATVAARDSWLAEATAVLRADRRVRGTVLVGSLGRGEADAFSDVDLIVAVTVPIPQDLLADPFTGLELPGSVLYRRSKPRNAPGGGAYLAVCLDLGGLPVLVDLYVWPVTTVAVPAGGRVLFEHDRLPHSTLDLLDLLTRCPATDGTGSDPQDPATMLMWVQLAGKYHARGDQPRRAAICRQLRIPDIDRVDELRQLQRTRLPMLSPAPQQAVAAVDRLLDVISALTKEVTVSTSLVPEPMTAEDARQQLVDHLSGKGWITRPGTAAAFAAVPRHLFAPAGTSLEAAYADAVVVTKRGLDGKTTSSISAPWFSLSTTIVL
ncbi:nucleotidyltransferase domain-containing protein [Paractinoplanes rishiriensis]|uniref:Uncharacterized protein n=1 Tax=Paractinoplanes rishiriensis TaxID=1050105 RepID=A0A919MZ76_9ACTN|nr:nucleotidyltransferase domain-containing protein [Actinoplanes rishiriensis]GIF01139.1 hypothetical protein Ari01nite_86030 [Actinoplanes rishiriensis]